MTGTRFAQLTCLMAVLLVSACGGGSPGTKKQAPEPSGLNLLENPSDPGIQFTKTTVGLRSTTLDFIGTEPLGLSGAKEANKIFMAADKNGLATVYSRDLDTLERKLVTTVKNLVPGSFTASSNGNFLVYCKRRRIDRYIDNPDINYPAVLSLPYLYNIATKEEIELFNFRQKDWMPFRAPNIDLFISPDGQRVCFLTYNFDRLMLDSQLQEWLSYIPTYQNPPEGATPEDIQGLENELWMLLGDSRLAPLLKQDGLDPFAKGPITNKEIDAVTKLQQFLQIPELALLVYEAGESRILPVHVPNEYNNHFYDINAIGNDRLVLGVKQIGSDPTQPHEVFDLDLATGEASLIGTYTGYPTTMEIDQAQEFFMVVLNPVDQETKLLQHQTVLFRIPLNGGDPSSIELPGDFIGIADISQTGNTILAQENSTSDLYFITTDPPTKTLLAKQIGQLSGVFINNNGTRGVFLDNGIVGVLPIMAEPQASETWVDDLFFEEYVGLVTGFISDAGYVLPPDSTFEWEERQGLGAHEIACAIFSPSENLTTALVRYSIEHQQIVSIWFPAGNNLIQTQQKNSTDLDFYDCQQIVENLLASVGWLNPDTRQYYQPGSNPLYDSRFNTYIIVYRDGYFLDGDKQGQWVTNIEATVVVSADDGSISEMTLSILDEVNGQKIVITPDRAAYMIRNQEDFAIPPKAPLEIDTINYRLVIGVKKEIAWGPARYSLRMIPRLCYELDGYILPENELILSALVDVVTGEVLGQISFMPTGVQDTGTTPGPGN